MYNDSQNTIAELKAENIGLKDKNIGLKAEVEQRDVQICTLKNMLHNYKNRSDDIGDCDDNLVGDYDDDDDDFVEPANINK